MVFITFSVSRGLQTSCSYAARSRCQNVSFKKTNCCLSHSEDLPHLCVDRACSCNPIPPNSTTNIQESIPHVLHVLLQQSKPYRPKDVSIEHGVFLHAIQRLRRELLKKRSESNTTPGKQTLPALKKISESVSPLSATASLQQSIDRIDIATTRGSKAQTSADGERST